MANKEHVVNALRFPAGDLQVDAAYDIYVGTVSVSFSGSANFQALAVNFTPILPADVTVIPLLIVLPGQANSSAPGGGASVFGFSSASGSPFGGSVQGPGVFRNVAIGDRVVVSGSANNGAGGGGSGDFMVIAFVRRK